jgi:hypothetical protein
MAISWDSRHRKATQAGGEREELGWSGVHHLQSYFLVEGACVARVR